MKNTFSSEAKDECLVLGDVKETVINVKPLGKVESLVYMQDCYYYGIMTTKVLVLYAL